jgi:acyl-CoA thioesterase I
MKTVVVIIVSAFVITTCAAVITVPGVSAAHAAAKIKVACIGNSITAGDGNYPMYLQKLLGSGYEVQNDGVSGTTMLKKGDTPYWTKGKLAQALTFKPDIVTIKLGTNDTKSQNWGSHYSEFKKDYLSMIDTLGSLSTKPDIFLVLPVPVFKTNNYGIRDSVLKLIMIIVKEIGAERKLPVIDANTPLLGFGKYFADGVHPNSAGSDTIAHVIYRALMAATEIGSKGEASGMQHRECRATSYGSTLSLRNNRLHSEEMYDLTGRTTCYRSGNGRESSACAGLYIKENHVAPIRP